MRTKYTVSVTFLDGVTHHGFVFDNTVAMDAFIRSLYKMVNYSGHEIKEVE